MNTSFEKVQGESPLKNPPGQFSPIKFPPGEILTQGIDRGKTHRSIPWSKTDWGEWPGDSPGGNSPHPL